MERLTGRDLSMYAIEKNVPMPIQRGGPRLLAPLPTGNANMTPLRRSDIVLAVALLCLAPFAGLGTMGISRAVTAAVTAPNLGQLVLQSIDKSGPIDYVLALIFASSAFTFFHGLTRARNGGDIAMAVLFFAIAMGAVAGMMVF